MSRNKQNGPERFDKDEMLRLARSGVAKVDQQGSRGTTLCTMQEIEAMACVCALAGIGSKRFSTPPSNGDET